MKITKIFFLLLFFAIAQNIHSQEIHLSMYNMAPLSINPASTGDHSQSFRAGINYRGQWNSISDATGYKTVGAFIDAPLFAAGQSSWIGLGLALTNDKAGTIGLSNTSVMGSVAAHIQMSSSSILSIGFQGGFVSRSFDSSKLLFEEQINISGANTPFDNTMNNGLFANNTNVNHGDLNLGLKYYSSTKKGSDITLGGSVRHIATMNNFIEGSDLPFLITLQGRASIVINNQLSFVPGLVYYQSASANQVNVQALARVKPGKKVSKYSIDLGLGYRAINNDAVIAIVQLDFQSYRVGLAYDINISELSAATNNRGGFELSLIYLAGDQKRFSAKQGCPTF